MKSLKAPAVACATLLLLGVLPASARAQSPNTALTAFEQRWESIAGYTATVGLFERAGANVQNSTLAYTFRKPSDAMIHFIAGDNAGVTMTWSGGPTVVAHRGSGFAALFKKTFPLRDPQVTTIRGSSIDELSFAAVIAHASQTPGTVSQTTGPTILDVPTEELTLVPTTPETDTGFTREVLDISVASSLPVRIQGYEGDVLVRELDFSDINVQAR